MGPPNAKRRAASAQRIQEDSVRGRASETSLSDALRMQGSAARRASGRTDQEIKKRSGCGLERAEAALTALRHVVHAFQRRLRSPSVCHHETEDGSGVNAHIIKVAGAMGRAAESYKITYEVAFQFHCLGSGPRRFPRSPEGRSSSRLYFTHSSGASARAWPPSALFSPPRH